MKPLDNLDQVRPLSFGQRVLLRPRQKMQRGIVGGYGGLGLRFSTGTRTKQHVSETGSTAAKGKPRDGVFPAGQVQVPGEDYPAVLGGTPWSVPRPFVLDLRAATELGYASATTYADAVKLTCDWLVETAFDEDWRERFPGMARSPELFDYCAEDRLLCRGIA